MEAEGFRCSRFRKVIRHLIVNPGKRTANEAQLHTKYQVRNQGASEYELGHFPLFLTHRHLREAMLARRLHP
jgi:hypothetical protein